ncbi:hypothetical protein GH714_003057 [Hevea brasiliensis]|uniref:3'-5' exonuclease domain-containing protein n=1 Tax=Hevea brasiliensis TaxID=3981 RepID=A0A6A6NAG5_HEVBR|nr:hypothetical protein GH714_003057 [Hevea brasiliensis]
MRYDIPLSLIQFLGHKKFKFVGKEVRNDAYKLFENYKLHVAHTKDVAYWAPRKIMTNYRMMGLKALVLDGLQKVIPKPREITMTEWNAKELTIEQIEYACLDAFVSLELGIFLSKHRREIIQYLENTSPKKIVNLTLESDQTTNDSEQLDDELNLRQSFGEYEEEESSARSCEVNFGRGNKSIQEQLRKIAKGEYTTPIIERRKLGTIVFAAINLPVPEICSSLDNDKHLEHNLKKTHLTLAHKRSHGVTAVASYGMFLNQKVPVELTALLFTDKMAALEAQPGSVDGEKVVSKNEWPHVTIWTAEGVAPKEANTLPRLFSEGKAIVLNSVRPSPYRAQCNFIEFNFFFSQIGFEA